MTAPEKCEAMIWPSWASGWTRCNQPIIRGKCARYGHEPDLEPEITTPAAPECPTPCDDDCDVACHEEHQPTWKREHTPDHAGPDVTEGDGLRSAIAQGIRDRINVRPVWTAERLADALLEGPLRDVLAAAARDADTVARVREEHANDGYGQCLGCQRECYMCQSVHEWPCPTIDALDVP